MLLGYRDGGTNYGAHAVAFIKSNPPNSSPVCAADVGTVFVTNNEPYGGAK